MNKYMKNFVVIVCISLLGANNQIVIEQQENDLMREVMQIIWGEAMNAKEATNIVVKTEEAKKVLKSNLFLSPIILN